MRFLTLKHFKINRQDKILEDLEIRLALMADLSKMKEAVFFKIKITNLVAFKEIKAFHHKMQAQ